METRPLQFKSKFGFDLYLKLLLKLDMCSLQITALNSDVERVKVDQTRLDHELDFIHSQQRELEEILGSLEKAMDQLPSINYQQHADLEREHTYVIMVVWGSRWW